MNTLPSFELTGCDRGIAAQLKSDGHTPDNLVNNAGTIKRKPAADHPETPTGIT